MVSTSEENKKPIEYNTLIKTSRVITGYVADVVAPVTISALNSRSSGLVGITVHCFWVRHFTFTVPYTIHPRYINGYRQIVVKPDEMLGVNL